MGLGAIFSKINEWGANERNDRAGVGKDWQAAQAAQLQRALQQDEEERAQKRAELAFNQKLHQAQFDETDRSRKRALVDDYLTHVKGVAALDPKSGRYAMPDDAGGDLSIYNEMTPEDRLLARTRGLGELNSARDRALYDQQQKDADELAKEKRHQADQLAILGATAGAARGTHASDRAYDIAHPLPEHDGKPYDYVAEGARLAAQAHAAKGDGKPPTPEEILSSAQAVKDAQDQFKRSQFAAKMRAEGDPLFADDPSTAPHDFGAAPPQPAGKKLPNGVTVRMVR
jgi:hypothetical protein